MLRFGSVCTGNPNSASLRLGSVRTGNSNFITFRLSSVKFHAMKFYLVVDQLIGFVVPAVQLTDLSTNLL